MPEYLTDICLLHANVGPVQPANYARNRRRPQLGVVVVVVGGPAVAGDLPVGEAERVLR